MTSKSTCALRLCLCWRSSCAVSGRCGGGLLLFRLDGAADGLCKRRLSGDPWTETEGQNWTCLCRVGKGAGESEAEVSCLCLCLFQSRLNLRACVRREGPTRACLKGGHRRRTGRSYAGYAESWTGTVN